MAHSSFKLSRFLLGGLSLTALVAVAIALPAARVRMAQGASQSVIPAPITDSAIATKPGQQTAVLAGGCFWGMEAVFEHVKGVSAVVSGFSGGSATTANYDQVSGGQTGHAEAIQITYDPAQISYGQLLKIYFSVAHDPTQLNRQGPDSGTQYRSAIFFANAEQQRVAQAYIGQLGQAKVFPQPIVTQLVPLKAFYAAAADHQDFIAHNPHHPYVVVHDLPKLAQLRQQFPDRYQ